MDALLPLVENDLASIWLFLPEAFLSLAALVLVVLDAALIRHPRRRVILCSTAFLALVFAAVLHFFRPISGTAFNGMVTADAFASFFGWLFLGAAAVTVLLAGLGKDFPGPRIGQFLALLLMVVVGLFFMASSTDLLMIYLSLELVSIPSYVLAGFRRADRRASEAALKYVIYGGVASGVMLFGMSYLFGLTGTTSLDVLGTRLASLAVAPGLSTAAVHLTMVVSVVFVLAGVGYKMAAVPFHMWCPDVYEGAPTPFTAFLSVGPKAAGFAMALRILHTVFARNEGGLAQAVAGIPWPAVVGILSAVTMTFGNLCALAQKNLKRLLAYSSIAQAGYALMGLAAASNRGDQAVLIQLAVYLVMNLGAFVVVILVAEATGSESIDDYRGLSRRYPAAAIAFAVFLFSLTGLPPFAGFAGKLWLFYAVFERINGPHGSGYALLALCGAVNTAISLYYYVRIVKTMFLDDSEPGQSAFPRRLGYAALFGAAVTGVLVLGLWWTPLIDWTSRSILSG